jgi:hypothetical protein
MKDMLSLVQHMEGKYLRMIFSVNPSQRRKQRARKKLHRLRNSMLDILRAALVCLLHTNFTGLLTRLSHRSHHVHVWWAIPSLDSETYRSSDTNAANSRFLNFHGQNGARLDRYSSVHGDVVPRTWLIAIVSPLLFFAPDIILRDFENIWVDSMVALNSWKTFLPKLSGNWQEFTISVRRLDLRHA